MNRETIIRRFRAHPLCALAAVLIPASLIAGACAQQASAQEIVLAGVDGGQLREADLKRGNVIVVVWASWSPRGRDVVGKVNDIGSRWGSRARVITVNYQESRAEVEGFLAGKGLRVPVYLDTEGEFSKKYSKPNLPVLLVFRDGDQPVRTALPDDPHQTIASALE
jgi:thiol-disulfide isomerase/thioredoxin